MSVDVQNAIMNLYDDASLTDELTDAPAQVLLKWAEAQIPDLAAQFPEDDTFDDALKTLRGLIKGINRLTGQRAVLSPEEQSETVDTLVARAQRLGYKADAAAAVNLLSQANSLAESDHVRALLIWVQTGSAEMAAAAPVDRGTAESSPTSPVPTPRPVVSGSLPVAPVDRPRWQDVPAADESRPADAPADEGF